jgi:hypothetical protein
MSDATAECDWTPPRESKVAQNEPRTGGQVALLRDPGFAAPDGKRLLHAALDNLSQHQRAAVAAELGALVVLGGCGEASPGKVVAERGNIRALLDRLWRAP